MLRPSPHHETQRLPNDDDDDDDDTTPIISIIISHTLHKHFTFSHSLLRPLLWVANFPYKSLVPAALY